MKWQKRVALFFVVLLLVAACGSAALAGETPPHPIVGVWEVDWEAMRELNAYESLYSNGGIYQRSVWYEFTDDGFFLISYKTTITYTVSDDVIHTHSPYFDDAIRFGFRDNKLILEMVDGEEWFFSRTDAVAAKETASALVGAWDLDASERFTPGYDMSVEFTADGKFIEYAATPVGTYEYTVFADTFRYFPPDKGQYTEIAYKIDGDTMLWFDDEISAETAYEVLARVK
ncbi:MAG: hypothetical protein FWE77_04440 [Clostridia bacterium]|nr:hypothetical protein [Clostridia bacterium]